MISYRLTNAVGSEVIVSLASKEPDTRSHIEYQGEELVIPLVRSWLEHEFGIFGHLIGRSTTPIDLSHAMSSASARQFNPVIIEGQQIIKRYKSSIPRDAVT